MVMAASSNPWSLENPRRASQVSSLACHSQIPQMNRPCVCRSLAHTRALAQASRLQCFKHQQPKIQYSIYSPHTPRPRPPIDRGTFKVVNPACARTQRASCIWLLLEKADNTQNMCRTASTSASLGRAGRRPMLVRWKLDGTATHGVASWVPMGLAVVMGLGAAKARQRPGLYLAMEMAMRAIRK